MIRYAVRLFVALLAASFAVTPLQAAAFEHGLPDDPSYFPIGVWLQNPQKAPEFKKIGINIFVGLWNGPTEAQLTLLAKSNMFALTNQNDIGLASPNNNLIKGWMVPGEPDNAQRNSLGAYGPCVPAADVVAYSEGLKARDRTRPVFVNFGMGLADPTWTGRGTCMADRGWYSAAIRRADILSFDIYPVAGGGPKSLGKLEYVGRGVDQLLLRASRDQSVWTFIETTKIQTSAVVTPDQLRAEVWLALTHGAKGIVYFVHEWTGGLREDGIFRHPEIVAAVTDVNRTITSLAPVINSENITETGQFITPGISAVVKRRGDAIYVLAVSEKNSDIQAKFYLPSLHNAQATVLNENRTIAVSNGSFLDRFTRYGVHLYKISLGNSH